MSKRFIFRSAKACSANLQSIDKAPRQFAEPSREQVEKAKKDWQRLAPKAAKELLK